MKKILFVLAVIFVAFSANAIGVVNKNTQTTKQCAEMCVGFDFDNFSGASADDARYYAERWVKPQLKDPKSYQRIEWKAERAKDDYNSWIVYIKFRAKNSFGAYVIQECLCVVTYGYGGNVSVEGLVQ